MKKDRFINFILCVICALVLMIVEEFLKPTIKHWIMITIVVSIYVMLEVCDKQLREADGV